MAVFILFFNTKQLALIYIRIASIFIILVAYEINTKYIDRMKQYEETQWLMENIPSHIALLTLAIMFSFTNTVNIFPHVAVWTLFFAPLLACTMAIPLHIVKITPMLSAIGCTLLLAYSIWLHGLRVCETIYNGITWCHNVVENFGLFIMIETHWVHLHIPQIFRAFWILRSAEFIKNALQKSCFLTLSTNELLKQIIVNGSDNIIALLGMTSIIALYSQFFGFSIQAFLQVNNPTERNIGNVSAFLFLILALQSGVTSADQEMRYELVSKNLCLIQIALLHFAYSLVNPALLSLSASKNPSTGKHTRALITAAFLIAIPAMLLIYQWQAKSAGFWLLAISSFLLELMVKTLVSVAIYILLTIDAYRNGLWENLDDYVYYLKMIGSSTEFFIGVYLLLNGLCIFLFTSPGAIRIAMMFLHAYFNIWIQGKKAWETHQLRHKAIEKINYLRVATKDELKLKKDVCAICFQELNSARITSCNHFFHGICLRKWLNVQDTCPLCHTTLNSSVNS